MMLKPIKNKRNFSTYVEILTFKNKFGEKSHSVQENDNCKNMPKLGKISQNMPIIE